MYYRYGTSTGVILLSYSLSYWRDVSKEYYPTFWSYNTQYILVRLCLSNCFLNKSYGIATHIIVNYLFGIVILRIVFVFFYDSPCHTLECLFSLVRTGTYVATLCIDGRNYLGIHFQFRSFKIHTFVYFNRGFWTRIFANLKVFFWSESILPDFGLYRKRHMVDNKLNYPRKNVKSSLFKFYFPYDHCPLE